MSRRQRTRSIVVLASVGLLGVLLAACGVGQSLPATTSGSLRVVVSTHHHRLRSTEPPTTTTSPPPTTTAAPTTTTTTTTTLPAPGPGVVPGHVTAIGDSVMLDSAPDLEQDIPGIDVEAFVSFQFYQGITLAQTLRSEGRLGAIVIIGLGTNGPFSDEQFDEMMSACAGASRVVFITTHVDQPWQDQVNATLAAGVARYPKVAVLANWEALAAANPEWFYADGTHMPIGGPGAQALAKLDASKI